MSSRNIEVCFCQNTQDLPCANPSFLEKSAGIDYNDVGWIEEFQIEDGEFLLLLEKSKDADFLIPVGGPNGMIQVYNGKVEEPNDERRTFFEEIF